MNTTHTPPDTITHTYIRTFITTVIALLLTCTLLGCTSNTDTTENSLASTPEQTQTSETTSDQADTKADTTTSSQTASDGASQATTLESITLADIPPYSGNPVYVVNNNLPFFSPDDLYVRDLESYSPLDSLGRCGVAIACIGIETMPTQERGSIGEVKPSGWVMAKYDCVDGKYLYNRCHLIGFQLAGENANNKNLITGTRYMNVDGMLPYENKIADYVERTSAHVLYRVTPLFDGTNPVAAGVLMEARSIEDSGAGVCFNVFAYNVQPGVGIDYTTGNSWLLQDEETTIPTDTQSPAYTYVLNTNSKKFHYPECSSVDKMSDKNKEEVYDTRENLIAKGYEPCGRCNP